MEQNMDRQLSELHVHMLQYPQTPQRCGAVGVDNLLATPWTAF